MAVLRDLAWQPQDALENLLASHRLWPALLCGVAGLYWPTLQTAESLVPQDTFGSLYLLVGICLALVWLIVLASIAHLAVYLVGTKRTPWRYRWVDIVILWGWTEVPRICLILLGGLGLYTMPYIHPWIAFEGPGLLVAFALLLLLVLWRFILKLQALRVCYQLAGWPLTRVVLVGLVLYAVLLSFKASYIDDRAVVSALGLKAMQATVSAPRVETPRWRRARVTLPFDVFTYRRRQPRRYEVVNFVPPAQHHKIHLTPGLRPRRRFLGRVVGLPGETVALRHGIAVINGQPQQEPYITKSIGITFPPTQVPVDHYFIVGDNRDLPLDTYHGGIVARRQILGRLSQVGHMALWLFGRLWEP
jgi:signal peptidase I